MQHHRILPKHEIRLRGGWTMLVQDQNPVFINLPFSLLPYLAENREAKLVRPFGAPRIDPKNERIDLRLESVPGLLSVRFNGSELDWQVDSRDPELIPLSGRMHSRNRLELTVSLKRATALSNASGQFEGETLWGSVSLVIADREDAAEPIGENPLDRLSYNPSGDSAKAHGRIDLV